jgi:PilZ domain-containing protein
MEVRRQFDPTRTAQAADPRRHPRYGLEAAITVNSRTSGIVSGRTVDISQSGVSALLKIEVPLGEVVKLEIVHPAGRADIFAVIRNRNAFRYGFEFMDTDDKVIGKICDELSRKTS